MIKKIALSAFILTVGVVMAGIVILTGTQSVEAAPLDKNLTVTRCQEFCYTDGIHYECVMSCPNDLLD